MIRGQADVQAATRRVPPVVAGGRAEHRVGQLALLDATGGTAAHQQRLTMVGLEALRHLAQVAVLRERTSRRRIGKRRRPALVDADAGGPARCPAVAEAARTAEVDRADPLVGRELIDDLATLVDRVDAPFIAQADSRGPARIQCIAGDRGRTAWPSHRCSSRSPRRCASDCRRRSRPCRPAHSNRVRRPT